MAGQKKTKQNPIAFRAVGLNKCDLLKKGRKRVPSNDIQTQT